MSHIFVEGHRGACALYPENTLKSLEIKGNKRDLRYLGIQRKNEEYPVHYEVLSGSIR